MMRVAGRATKRAMGRVEATTVAAGRTGVMTTPGLGSAGATMTGGLGGIGATITGGGAIGAGAGMVPRIRTPHAGGFAPPRFSRTPCAGGIE